MLKGQYISSFVIFEKWGKMIKELLFIVATTLSIQSFASSNWTCFLDGEEALTIIDSKMTISSDAVCDALNIECPFQTQPSATGYELGRQYFPAFDGKYIWGAVKGKYEDGVIFYSDNSGMKVNSLYTGSNASVNWRNDWFFNEGECLRKQ